MHTWPRSVIRVAALCLFTFIFCLDSDAARIKDLGRIEGYRSNQLFGYGLVIGLNGTGDKQNTEFTVQTLSNLLQDYNIRVNPSDVRVKNVAAVTGISAFKPPILRISCSPPSA
mgnify:CR=1 FL=1